MPVLMRNDGFTNIVCMDYSISAIEKMKQFEQEGLECKASL